MTVRQALQRAAEVLSSYHIENARLTAEVLLRHILEISRVSLFQDPDKEITPEQYTRFIILVERHIQGEPVAYLTGQKEFYGFDFIVDNSVLIPRPETELLVERALKTAGNIAAVSIADVGTGSGAVAISLALNLPAAVIYAVDISSQAIKTAGENSVRHGVETKIRFLEGDLLDPLPEAVDLIVANLPYVRAAELNEPSIRFEPRTALDGGPDGLNCIRRFVPQIKGKLKSGGSVLMEIGPGQSESVRLLLQNAFPDTRIAAYKDFNDIARVIELSTNP